MSCKPCFKLVQTFALLLVELAYHLAKMAVNGFCKRYTNKFFEIFCANVAQTVLYTVPNTPISRQHSIRNRRAGFFCRELRLSVIGRKVQNPFNGEWYYYPIIK